ncbi:type II toxin-antitoxin system RelE/ParE family toxin [Edwardsiella tarda]|uniref:Plasmid stabilization protein n=1 Tax=Edwardsiella tarda TaxID=636 RepID=A0A2S1PMK4_EDWTA|nr:plasmid stabilization protein [Edwardsiella tarda]
MSTSVKWSDKALSDRQNIFDINCKDSDIGYAKSEDKKFSKAVEMIKDNNFIGRNDLDERGYLYKLPKRYKVLYRLDGGVIFVERIFY